MGSLRERFPAEPLEVRAALIRIGRGALLQALEASSREIVLLVLAEVLNNVAEHAYHGPKGDVTVTLMQVRGGISARVVDRGVKAPSLAGCRSPDPIGLPEGGFGWPMIRALTQGVEQRRRFGCNVVHLRFSSDDRTEGGKLFPVSVE